MATTKVIPDVLDLNEATSESGLKMPSGTGGNRPTAATAQIRNNTGESSNSSSSCEEYYNGATWKVLNNTAPTPAPAPLLDLSSASLTATEVLNVGESPDSDGLRGYSLVPDGSALYGTSLSTGGDDYLHKYTFSTPFDVTTVSASATTFQTTSTIPNYLTGCLINSDQSIIAYDPYATNDWYIRAFGTNGDITTLQPSITKTCSRSGGDRVANAMIYSDNENKMYWFNTSMRKFDLNTKGAPGSGPECPAQIPNTDYSDFSSDLDGNNIRTLYLNTDGVQLTIAGDGARLAQFTLSTPWDITTRGSATKFDFSTLLGGTPEIKGLFPNAAYTKLILASAYNPIDTLYELAL
tara:strand:+ start:864 stop:1919 length:1056 start_codon:yes stop_codon:yes gene_type:complete